MPRRSILERLFNALLRLFPSEFRGDFGEELTADFRDQRTQAALAGKRVSAGLWVRALVDLASRAPAEHLEILRRDAGYALRLMRRRPAFAAGTGLTLAIGIGLNTAVFSIVSGVLLRNLPFSASERLVRLYEVKSSAPDDPDDVSSMNFIDWQAQARSLDGLALVGSTTATVIAGDLDPEQVVATTVSHGFFEMLGTRPALGRLFSERDYDSVRAKLVAMRQGPARQLRWPVPPDVVILSHEFWQRYFQGRPDVIGTRVRWNDSTVEVIGVLPPRFALTRNPIRGEAADCWLIEIPDPGVNFRRSARLLGAIGRLAPGVSMAQAQAEFSLIGAQLAQAYPEANKGWTVRVVPLLDTMVKGVRNELWFLFGAAICVLLITCANIANLLAASARGRQFELATRVAIGATRAHLMRQMLTESFVLTTIGGIGGFLLASWALPLLISIAPADIPRLTEVTVDWSMFVFALAVSWAVGIGCGVAACWAVGRVTPGRAIRSTLNSGRGRAIGFRRGLTTAQVTLAMLLIIAAGLLVRTARALGAVELGFNPHGVVTVQLNPAFQKYRRFGDQLALHADLIRRIRTRPGVVAIGTGPRPLAGGTQNMVGADISAEAERMDVVAVNAGYFAALGARAVQGRLIEDADTQDAKAVALINETGARHFFGGGQAIGRTLYMDRKPMEIVGILKDIRNRGLEADVQPAVYLAQAQTGSLLFNTLLIRTQGDPLEIVPVVRTFLKQIDPEQPLTAVETLDERVDKLMAPRRFILRLVGTFSLLALGLALLGIYAVLAESVAQRVPEIGVRIALGATRAKIIRMVVMQGAWMVGVGMGLGIAAAIALRHLMTTLVFGVPTGDRLTFIAACVGMALAALAACWMPARRAAGIDPVVALRQE